ncbi:hypothetical protein FGG66_gp28 [Corynebacterium phage phi674]|uniref:Uncharacterized protein n=1 Tax=Corynebacterium phage phi674 TaxID=2052822 RepID=A0A2H4PJ16_9CAUD|nr:hypothetical protein FGG66_gp28 [Corynebacterium phage phi674]ATW62946.1 hypothetical protein phi674_gp28 [Corynebacterium phage phi674]
MNYTYRHMLRAVHALQLDGAFNIVACKPLRETITAITTERLAVDFYIERDWVDGTTTVLWTSGTEHSDGVVVESENQVITDLDAQIGKLRKATS